MKSIKLHITWHTSVTPPSSMLGVPEHIDSVESMLVRWGVRTSQTGAEEPGTFPPAAPDCNAAQCPDGPNWGQHEPATATTTQTLPRLPLIRPHSLTSAGTDFSQLPLSLFLPIFQRTPNINSRMILIYIPSSLRSRKQEFMTMQLTRLCLELDRTLKQLSVCLLYLMRWCSV